jgi:hypothetical protein
LFLDRIATGSHEEVRRISGAYFREWASRLTPDTLASLEAVESFITLIDTHPQAYLPRLRHLIERSTPAQLRASEDTAGSGKWGPRRLLVWLCERFAQLPEHFNDSEAILFCLALAESEPEIANNATEIWKQLFRIMLSGTPVPFGDRLERLRSRLDRDNPPGERELALAALSSVLDDGGSRVLGPAIVAGRIPPAEWNPRTYQEEQECHRAATELLLTVAEDETDDLRGQVITRLISEIRRFLYRGYLDVLHRVGELVSSRGASAELLSQIDLFLTHDAVNAGASAAEYVADVVEFRSRRVGSDFQSLLTYHVGTDPWTTRKFEPNWKPELRALAEHAMKEPAALLVELDWLLSREARSAAQFGEALGHVDASATFLTDVLNRSSRSDSNAFATGYVWGLLGLHPHHSVTVREWLDRYQLEFPEFATEIALRAPNLLNAVDRILDLFDRHLIGPGYLHGLRLFPDWMKADVEKVEAVLTRLADAAAGDHSGATRVLLDTLYFFLPDTQAEHHPIFDRAAVQNAAWKVLKSGSVEEMRRSGEWAAIMLKMAEYNAEQAVSIAADVLISDSWGIRSEAKEVLARLALRHPDAVMAQVGLRALDSEHGWRFFVADFKSIIRSLPIGIVQAWVEENGIGAARAIARHVPEPSLSGEHATVPPLTAWLLTKYGEDDRLFSEFCAGIHGFRTYWGDLSAHLESEAELAEKFLDHPIQRIREWAAAESLSARARARHERTRAEEFDLP